MRTWKDLPDLMGPRVLESDRGLASTFVRFDNGIFLRMEPLPHTPDLLLRFALLQAANGTALSPPLAEAGRHLRGGLGYRFTKVVGLPIGDKDGTLEDADRLNDMRLLLAATSARLYVAASAHPERLQANDPMWNARAEFTVVGEQRGWTEPLDFTAVAPRVSASIDKVLGFLSDAIAGSRAPS